MFTQDLNILCEIDNEVAFYFIERKYNILFYKIKSKLLLFKSFHEHIYFRIYVGFTHVGLNIGAYTC